MTRFCHVSDTHGLLYGIDGDAEVLLHTGDFMPSFSRGIKPIEEFRQTEWIHDKAEELVRWIGSRPFIFVPGNHDYIDPCPELRMYGIQCHNLYTEGPIVIDGKRIVGFPYVHLFTGEWNFELRMEAFAAAMGDLRDTMDVPSDIVMTHSPIEGVLDRNHRGTRCGSPLLRALAEQVFHPPKVWLSGHLHESAGKCGWKRGIVCYNSATIYQSFEL